MLYVCMYVSGFFPGRACGRGLGGVWDHIKYFDISSVESIGGHSPKRAWGEHCMYVCIYACNGVAYIW